MNHQKMLSFSFSILSILGIVVCVICDFAISKTLTWSLYPISSIVFGWLIFYPIVRHNQKGILYSLIMLTIFLLPFLFFLYKLLDSPDLFMPIGISVSVLSLIFLWIVYILIKKVRMLIAIAISLILSFFLYIGIHLVLSKIIGQSIIEIWDILSYSSILIGGIVVLIIENKIKNKK